MALVADGKSYLAFTRPKRKVVLLLRAGVSVTHISSAQSFIYTAEIEYKDLEYVLR